MTGCPSDLELEGHLLDPRMSRLGPHLAACARCRIRLDEMHRVGEEFRREVYPATVHAVGEAAARPHRGRKHTLAYLAPLPAVAAAAVVFLLVVGRRPPGDYLGMKGDGFVFSVFAQTGAGARMIADGETVPAGAALRFRVRPPATCRLWLVSVDATGQVSRLYPASGDGGAPVTSPEALPGGAVLDGRSGPERLYAVCTQQPLPFVDLERAARAVADGGEAAVRSAATLPGLPAGALQATVLLEKRP